MSAARTWLSWSSGKDSAWALHKLRGDQHFEVEALITTVTSGVERVSIHGVRREVLRAQADAAGLPLREIEIPYPCPNGRYEEAMAGLVAKAHEVGVECFAFGDLFLEDIRRYRESMLERSGIRPIFPIWGEPTDTLAEAMIEGGLAAYVVAVQSDRLDPAFAGRAFDRSFLAEIPDGVDPCGEHGEFHTCAVAGPMFARALSVELGDRHAGEGMAYRDLRIISTQ